MSLGNGACSQPPQQRSTIDSEMYMNGTLFAQMMGQHIKEVGEYGHANEKKKKQTSCERHRAKSGRDYSAQRSKMPRARLGKGGGGGGDEEKMNENKGIKVRTGRAVSCWHRR